MERRISDYWIQMIKDTYPNADIKIKEDRMLDIAIIDNIHIIRYNRPANALTYARKILYLKEYEPTVRKEEYICGYGCELESVEIALDDIKKYIDFIESIKNTDWKNKCLKSTYHEYAKEEFYLEVFETDYQVPTGFAGHKELCLLCDTLDGKVKEGKQWLRASLIGKLYIIVEKPKKQPKQMSIFDY